MEEFHIYLILTAIFGLFMAWGIGANDVANAMATSVGSKALTVKSAIIIAAIFEFAGAWLAGGEVTKTIRKGIVDTSLFVGQPEVLIWGMLASLLAAGVWLLFASQRGWPVSTTHSIVGAIVGFTMVGVSTNAVDWSSVGTIVMSWVVSPLMAGTIAFTIQISILKFILNTEDPVKNALRYGPVYIFAVGTMIMLVTLKKGLKNMGLSFSEPQCFGLALLTGLVVAALGTAMIKRLHKTSPTKTHIEFNPVERIFAVLMIFTASAMAFAHGSNDVANAVGPMAAVINTVQTGTVTAEAGLATWILLIGALGIVVGLSTYGFKVMRTIGKKITELTPTRGFSAEMAAASTVVLASYIGAPISTTHTLIGAVIGVGLARGKQQVEFSTVTRIFASWLVTLPAGAILSIIFFYLLRAIFS